MPITFSALASVASARGGLSVLCSFNLGDKVSWVVSWVRVRLPFKESSHVLKSFLLKRLQPFYEERVCSPPCLFTQWARTATPLFFCLSVVIFADKLTDKSIPPFS